MKIAVATDEGSVSPHFSRCSRYTVFTVDGSSVTETYTLDNPPHEPGFLPAYLKSEGVDVVICGGMGPRAQDLFSSLGIKAVVGVTGDVSAVVRDYLSGQLNSSSSTCTHDQEGHVECDHHRT